MSEIQKNKATIQEMFTSISGTYDKLNGILSLGWYKLWYRSIIRKSKKIPHSNILDCATGTGNLAIKFKEKFPESELSGVDFSDGMLKIAQEKANEKNLDISFLNADILNLPFNDSIYDIASISFGIRNTESTHNCLREMARVIKPGGTIFILEFGRPEGPMSLFFSIYQKLFIPMIGRKISKSSSAYNYLRDSVIDFLYDYDFLDLMNSTNCFTQSSFKRLSGGIAYLYYAKVKK